MKNLLFLIVWCAATTFCAKAQQQQQRQPLPDSEYVYTFVEQMPEFPGGQEAMQKFIKDNLKYPNVSGADRKHGRVAVQFVVGKDGTIKNVQIAKSLGTAYDDEVYKMIYAMPKWISGKQNGKAVNVRYLLPVDFK